MTTVVTDLGMPEACEKGVREGASGPLWRSPLLDMVTGRENKERATFGMAKLGAEKTWHQ